MHYKSIKLNINIPLNIQHFHLILRFCARSAPIFFFWGGIFQLPPPHPKNGSMPLLYCASERLRNMNMRASAASELNFFWTFSQSFCRYFRYFLSKTFIFRSQITSAYKKINQCTFIITYSMIMII